MTWTLKAAGHHNTDDWKAEEYALLRSLVEAVNADDATVTSSFEFHGNHVSVSSIDEAREALEAYEPERRSDALNNTSLRQDVEGAPAAPENGGDDSTAVNNTKVVDGEVDPAAQKAADTEPAGDDEDGADEEE